MSETYKLIYPAPFPGRGEFARILLEEAGVSYAEGSRSELSSLTSADYLGDAANTALYAPPILQCGDLTISQTPNILQFLGQRLDLCGKTADPNTVYRLNGLVLTALDGFSNEIHACHHPIGGGLHYEEQKEESLRRSRDYVSTRLPAFLGYFERVLQGESSGKGPWLHEGTLTYCDLVLFQCLDGVKHQFPTAMDRAEASKKYERVFALYDAVQNLPRVNAYLQSDRRLQYSNGIWRFYAELGSL